MLDNQPRGTIVIEDLEIGMVRSLTKQVTDLDIELFAQVSTDRNPVHLDEDYAQDTIFEGRIAHGMLTAGLISAVIGEQLPGHGTVYLGQSLKFMAPVRPGDRVEAQVSVRSIDYAKRRVTLDCGVDGEGQPLRGDERHRHHREEKDHTGARVIQHPTLAARDAYAARGGWWSEREITAIHYSRKFGWAGSNNITPEMLA